MAVRLHLHGGAGEYLPPKGYHRTVNGNWFEDNYGEFVDGYNQYAYIPGKCVADLPLGEVFVEICRGYEVRMAVVALTGRGSYNWGTRRIAMGFWNDVCRLRAENAIPRVWKREHLMERLSYAPSTIRTVPSNWSIAREGTGIGDSVMRGREPKAWRVGVGTFELIEDPDDDESTRQSNRACASERADHLRERGSRDQHKTGIRNVLPRPIKVCLTETERRSIEGLRTAMKADWLVRKYLREKHGSTAIIEEDHNGSDIRVSFDGKTESIEIKGTRSTEIALGKLKVSSRRSHYALTTMAARMYRVVDVDSSTPRIYILEHGVHYRLAPEPRWAATSVSRRANEYPLRGARYRLDRPFDSVAEHEWAVDK